MKSRSISLPPIRPDDMISPLFVLLNDYYEDILSKYEREDIRDLKKLDKLESKLSLLLSLLHFLFLHVVYAHPIQIDQKTPQKMKKQLHTVSNFILSLDREKYRGFLNKTLNKINKLRTKAVQLNMKIIKKMELLQQQKQQRVPSLLFQLQPPPPLTRSIRYNQNNRIQLLNPPSLSRSTRGFQF